MSCAARSPRTVGEIWALQPVLVYLIKATDLSVKTSMRIARHLQRIKPILAETEKRMMTLGSKYGEREGPADFSFKDERRRLKYLEERGDLLADAATFESAEPPPRIPAADLGPAGLPPQVLSAFYFAIDWAGWEAPDPAESRGLTFRQLFDADTAFHRLSLAAGLPHDAALAVAAYLRACYPLTQEITATFLRLRAEHGEYSESLGSYVVPPRGGAACAFHDAVETFLGTRTAIPAFPLIPAASLAAAELEPGMLAALSAFMVSDLEDEEEAAAELSKGRARRAELEEARSRLEEMEKGRGADPQKFGTAADVSRLAKKEAR